MRKKIVKKEIFPTISIIIAAHNEEKIIEEKIKNTLNLDYPAKKMEIIVASDASDDDTERIVKTFEDRGVKLLTFPERRGKTHVQNETAKIATGKILLFSDATTIYDKYLIKKLVRNFADYKVGLVGGKLKYINQKHNSMGDGDCLYWKYEDFIKTRENITGSLIGVSGCCYAVRKDVFEPINPSLISDFLIVPMVYKKKKKIVYEPEAVSYEESNSQSKDEFKMRVRIADRTLNGLSNTRELFNPFQYGFLSIQIIFHKVLRYLVPVFLVCMFTANLAIVLYASKPFYKTIFILQCIFYLSAIYGALRIKHVKKKIFFVPYYFCLTNLALFVGLLEFIKGKNQVVWESSREKADV
jgi:cellulose synthase/poly-beta-1,6-N-acetylglucosamine synthase-like glycosyltransferase